MPCHTLIKLKPNIVTENSYLTTTLSSWRRIYLTVPSLESSSFIITKLKTLDDVTCLDCASLKITNPNVHANCHWDFALDSEFNPHNS